MENRAGHNKINLSGKMAIKSFVPNPSSPVPPIELTENIVSLLIKANSRIAVLETVPLHMRLISTFCAKELEARIHRNFLYFKLNNIISVRSICRRIDAFLMTIKNETALFLYDTYLLDKRRTSHR